MISSATRSVMVRVSLTVLYASTTKKIIAQAAMAHVCAMVTRSRRTSDLRLTWPVGAGRIEPSGSSAAQKVRRSSTNSSSLRVEIASMPRFVRRTWR